MERLTINSVEDLINFLKHHYEMLSDSEYMTLLKETLDVYAIGKPTSLEVAIADIKNTWNIIEQNPIEKPIFIHEDL